jgi:hypothetical protein
MKKVTVHAWVQDNSGSYHKPGSQLIVDDKGGEGCITAKAADQLLQGNAVPHSEAKAAPAPAAK